VNCYGLSNVICGREEGEEVKSWSVLKCFVVAVSIARLSCLLNFAYILTLCCLFLPPARSILLKTHSCLRFFSSLSCPFFSTKRRKLGNASRSLDDKNRVGLFRNGQWNFCIFMNFLLHLSCVYLMLLCVPDWLKEFDDWNFEFSYFPSCCCCSIDVSARFWHNNSELSWSNLDDSDSSTLHIYANWNSSLLSSNVLVCPTRWESAKFKLQNAQESWAVQRNSELWGYVISKTEEIFFQWNSLP
jgi:hypothetical protein